MTAEKMSITCSVCSNQYEVTVAPEDLAKYRAGAHAQHVFPYLSAGERELIISGVCGECFDRLFDEDFDNEAL